MDWLNAVDQSYRSEFRELFELNFARFDAKLDQRTAELRAEMRTELANLRAEFIQRMAHTEKTLIRWMFLFWIGSWGTVIGTLVALQKLGWLIVTPR